ncbi:MAG: heparinase II/III-family protein, partial [Lachnospiraceae bacterium]|nr:heparinase II/III-family protein [Lachnospiraceae bacterium]
PPGATRETLAEDKKPFLGMSFSRFEKFSAATKCLKDFFDCTVKLLTEDGIMFSVNDSNEQDFTELYGKAYYLYGDERYKKIASRALLSELLFVQQEDGGEGFGWGKDNNELSGQEIQQKRESLLLNGAGFGILRKEDCQAVLKFGVHGGYHGHFDRLSLASFFKGGKTFHNNEYAWYGYGSFLFKMWVQTSMAHNMVVVDGRMQEPSPCRCIYYEPEGKIIDLSEEKERENGRMEHTFCGVCAETTTKWSDPPYGGQTPYPLSFPKEKCEKEGRYILMPGKPRKQGEIGEYSEPVFQRRLLILFHGYCIVWDYLLGEQEHRYDCLYHPMGRFDNEGGFKFTQKARFSDDPFGAGQFVRNCYTAPVDGAVCLRFHDAPARVNPNDIMDFTPESAVWRAWPKSGEVTIARYPQRKDRFTEEEFMQNAGFLQEPLKKTVSFTVQGRRAEFITILETGEKTGKIKNIQCESFSSLLVTEDTGEKWKIMVEGMEDVTILQNVENTEDMEKRDKISVKIRCENKGGR